jgi:hypothetical protein
MSTLNIFLPVPVLIALAWLSGAFCWWPRFTMQVSLLGKVIKSGEMIVWKVLEMARFPSTNLSDDVEDE